MTDLDCPNVFLPDLWAVHARHFPRKPAIVCGEDRLTWAAFDAGMNRVANRLLAADIGKGDAVAVVMSNSCRMVEAMFGITRAGACMVPISTLLTAEQIGEMIDDSGAVAVIASAAHQATLDAIKAGRRAVRSDGWIAADFEAPGWTAWDRWLGDVPATSPDVGYELEQPFNIIYSSGTTGMPKGILQTHRARQHWSYSNALELRMDVTSRALATTSLYSNGTWFMLLPPLFVGATVHVMPSFDPLGFLETVAREKITHTFMVPTQYIVTLGHADFDRHDLSSLKTMLSAGSALRPDTKEQILARMGPGLYELYGASEGLATMIKPEHADKTGSVGTPVLGFDIRIIDDDGREQPWGAVGEIVGYGAGLMQRYHNRPDATAAAIWRDERGRSFFRTGDIGRFDEDGFLYILDRKKDMIISGGFNIFPADIEQVVGRHDAVRDVTVIGVPHEKWGETPLALVIPEPGARADAEAIRDWANARLAKTQRLAGVEFRDDFPRNALGKVLKRFLREPYWKKDGA